MAFVAHVTKASRKGGTTRQGNKIVGLGDLYRHNERKGAYGNAENIDKSKTVKNYALDDYPEEFDYVKRLDAIKAANGVTAKERSVGVASIVISASQEEMDNMSEAEQRQYFIDVKAKLDEHFGKENLVYAEVHNDEKTPHMHIGYVPIYENENGKKSIRWGDIQKNRETGEKIYKGPVHRDFLKYLQNDLPEELIEKGYKIELGSKTSTRHMETGEWRELSKREEKVKSDRELLDRNYAYRKGIFEAEKEASLKEVEDAKTRQARVLQEREALLAEQVKKSEERAEELQRAEEEMNARKKKLREREKALEEKETKVDERMKAVDHNRKVIYSGVGRKIGMTEVETEAFMNATKGNVVNSLINQSTSRLMKHKRWEDEAIGVSDVKHSIAPVNRSKPLATAFLTNDRFSQQSRLNLFSVAVVERYSKEREDDNNRFMNETQLLKVAINNATYKDLEDGFMKRIAKLPEDEQKRVKGVFDNRENAYAENARKLKEEDLRKSREASRAQAVRNAEKKQNDKVSDTGRSRMR